MPYDRRILGYTIRTLRQKKGLSQEALSGLAVVSRSQLAAIESGCSNPHIDTLWRVSEVLGIKLSELIKLVENEDGKEPP